jgi:hypothetical protein
MATLCHQDGGLRVYEQVRLSSDEFEQNHKRLYYKESVGNRENLLGPHYRLVESSENVAGTSGNIEKGYVRKITTQIIRRFDGKLLGESVLYIRVGGDGLSSIINWHSSSNRCPEERPDIINAVFKKELTK